MKIIVTHFNPDLDAVCSVWLVKRFLPGFGKAEIKFVPAGETFRGAPADADPEIFHVDTGLGCLDHHQKKGYTSSAELCLKKIFRKTKIGKEKGETLKRLVAIVTEIDNGRDITWSDPLSDRYEFCLHNFLEKMDGGGEDQKILDFSTQALDAIYQTLKGKIGAEKELKKGTSFKTKWGKAIAVLTENDQVLSLGEKQGYILVAKQDPRNNHLRIYSRWDKGVDLSLPYKEFKRLDPGATWYLHPSLCLLLNGSRSDPNMVPTKLSLSEIIEILKQA
ncbi:MAG: hypothetical protein ACOZBZ_02865 [Patescibacteria group bacterium]